MIILTKDQADKIRGMTSKFTALDPIEIKDGSFVLPEIVLTDEAHLIKKSQLQTLPVRTVAKSEYLDENSTFKVMT
jgi:hypothetical protein